MRNEGGGFAEILRLRSQLFWHSLSHIRRFSPLRMTKRGDARRLYELMRSSYRKPSPRGEGAPKGRIGHWRYEREWGNAFQAGDLRQQASADFGKRRCAKVDIGTGRETTPWRYVFLLLHIYRLSVCKEDFSLRSK